MYILKPFEKLAEVCVYAVKNLNADIISIPDGYSFFKKTLPLLSLLGLANLVACGKDSGDEKGEAATLASAYWTLDNREGGGHVLMIALPAKSLDSKAVKCKVTVKTPDTEKEFTIEPEDRSIASGRKGKREQKNACRLKNYNNGAAVPLVLLLAHVDQWGLKTIDAYKKLTETNEEDIFRKLDFIAAQTEEKQQNKLAEEGKEKTPYFSEGTRLDQQHKEHEAQCAMAVAEEAYNYLVPFLKGLEWTVTAQGLDAADEPVGNAFTAVPTAITY